MQNYIRMTSRKMMACILILVVIISSAQITAFANSNNLFSLNAEERVLPEASLLDLETQPYIMYSDYLDFSPINWSVSQHLASMNGVIVDYYSGGEWHDYEKVISSGAKHYRIGGLTPNTDYTFRFTGCVYNYFTRKYSFTVVDEVALHTGMPTTPIKSIKVKAVKVKYHKKPVYGYYTGLRLGTTKYYTYKLKVTVKFKSAPGTPGIFINGEWVGGNKKTYTKTFPTTLYSYSKPRKNRISIGVYSGFNPTWGGYSPIYLSNQKVK